MGNLFSVSLSCDAIAFRCWDSFVGRKHYVSKLQEDLEALDSSLQDLTSLKNDVKRRAEVAEQQPQMKRLDQVQIWISRVDTIEAQVNQVVNDGPQQIEKLCCGGYCSKYYISSYKYGKKVAKKLVELSELKNRGEHFEEVAAKTLLPPALVIERLLEPTVGMETMFDEVWSHIENEDLGVIGLYGMGGVGKTTLLTNINNNFQHAPNDFNIVIWIVVSKDIKLEIIQDKIAKEVGVIDDKWKDKEQHEKAQEIFGILSKKKFVLLLDDMWDWVDLTKVGVPVSNQRNNSKIVFTTRSEDVCGRMGAQKKIRVKCLDWYKALNLFQEKVGKETLSLHPDIPKLAEAVAKECGGLPLALVTVGRAMACKKTPEEWNHAIHVLKKSAPEFSGMGDKVFPLLKFSYDNLPCQKVKSCFLYCALFPEDFSISIDELLYCWMSEEILNKYVNVDEARNEVYDILGTLLNACLLEGEGDIVKMHDVIRDMALWLASDPEKTKESFLVQTGAQLIEAPTLGKWENSKRVSFVANRIENLVETPKSPNLLTLFLRDNNLKMIAESFIDFMPILRVLDLSENKDLIRLPSGVSKLVSLQHLNLSRTGIRELPTELKALTRLTYLNLEYTAELEFIPPNTLSSFRRLEVLRMSGSNYQLLSEDNEAMIEELKGLKQLDIFTLTVRSITCLERFVSYRRLLTCTRNLNIEVFDVNFDVNLPTMKSKDLDFLEISNYGRFKQVENYWARQAAKGPRNSMVIDRLCLLGLQSVVISGFSSLTDLTWLIANAQNITYLSVDGCSEMKTIIDLKKLLKVEHMVEEWKPFAKLTHLILSQLPVLKSIYNNPMNFPYIKEICISGCPSLEKLPFNSSCAQGCYTILIEGVDAWWDGLKWEDQLAQNVFLPFFRSTGATLPAPAHLLYFT
ncbi:probable disease resistance protein At5g63020 isoform X2 [Rosa rugosa]|uniref:probable disease resistance protein At5g63020 isoform X2 n=1 Tax=Rosa rugosa TaxID=74645 RepID=UPI002B4034C5|nr:probable disease resistance protein At5g63020 isoform X2 [Rosa rugosa]